MYSQSWSLLKRISSPKLWNTDFLSHTYIDGFGVFAQVLRYQFLRFLPQSQYNGGEWDFVFGAHHTENWHFKNSIVSCLFRKNALVTLDNPRHCHCSLLTIYIFNCFLKKVSPDMINIVLFCWDNLKHFVKFKENVTADLKQDDLFGYIKWVPYKWIWKEIGLFKCSECHSSIVLGWGQSKRDISKCQQIKPK